MALTGDGERGLSEFELIELFAARPPDPPRIRVGIGDDAAVVATSGRSVTSVDTVVEGVHFRRDWSSPEQIASKAIGSALSDLAAMGAGETGADVFLSLGAPRESDPRFLAALAAGAGAVAARHGATLAGGDTVSSPVLFLAVTVTAHAGSEDPLVTRAGACPGDLVAVTGRLGAARAGLWLLENPALPVTPELPPEVRAGLISRQLEAEPRIAAGAALARAGATAMVDLSDGLVADLGHIAAASSADGAGAATPSTGEAGAAASSMGEARTLIRVESELVPSAEGAAEVAIATGLDPLNPALTGGEDYELALTLPADRLSVAVAALAAGRVPLTVIGEVTTAPPGEGGNVVVLRGGAPIETGRAGFDHFV